MVNAKEIINLATLAFTIKDKQQKLVLENAVYELENENLRLRH